MEISHSSFSAFSCLLQEKGRCLSDDGERLDAPEQAAVQVSGLEPGRPVPCQLVRNWIPDGFEDQSIRLPLRELVPGVADGRGHHDGLHDPPPAEGD